MFRCKHSLLFKISILAIVAAVCAAASAAAPDTSASAGPDLGYVTPGAVAMLVAYPSRVLKAPGMELLPHEVITAAGKQELGLDPADIDQVLVVSEVAGGPPLVAAVVRFSKPHKLEDLFPKLAAATEAGQLEGKPYLQAANPMEPSLYMPDERTLLVGMGPMIEKMIANAKQPQAGPLARLVSSARLTGDVTVVAVMEPVRDMLGAMLAMAPLPPPLEDLKQIPELTKAAKIEVQWTAMPQITVAIVAPDEAKAQQLEALINKAIDLGQQMALQQMQQGMEETQDPVQQATAQYMVRLNEYLFKLLRPQRRGTILSVTQGGQQSVQVATTGVLISLLLPAVQAAREAARRSQSQNNLKQIGLAFHNHHDTFKELPPRAIADPSGKPLLSWRVKLLPFLEEKALYDQFHLDEPWDSQHNKQLLAQMPAVYARPGSKAAPGMTVYLAPVADGTIWNAGKAISFAAIRDGTSNTIAVVEAADGAAVPWTKPDDWQVDPSDPLKGVRDSRPGGFQALILDGSVRFLANSLDPAVFKALLTMAGGESLNPF